MLVERAHVPSTLVDDAELGSDVCPFGIRHTGITDLDPCRKAMLKVVVDAHRSTWMGTAELDAGRRLLEEIGDAHGKIAREIGIAWRVRTGAHPFQRPQEFRIHHCAVSNDDAR